MRRRRNVRWPRAVDASPALEKTQVFFKKGYQVLGFLAGLKDFKVFLYEDRTRKDDPKANGLSKHRI